MDKTLAMANARRSLEGLSVGDAFGELFFRISPANPSLAAMPAGPWPWTDDTHMALSIAEVLDAHDEINQDALARAFARRYAQQPYRGYAGGAARLLSAVASGGRWQELSPRLFGSGSFGNGGAMRAAPIGAYFCDDLTRVAQEARKSALVTHAHAEGQAGAIAAAIAAALAAATPRLNGGDFIREVAKHVPAGLTRNGILAAVDIPGDALVEAARQLGTGDEVSAQDTVPFCIWSAAYHLNDFATAMWWTVQGLGDRDTTCAIVGGIVALSAAVPPQWAARREPLAGQ